ncbi:hypothetical protein POTOM_034528 [Populus tomentosa]|uniref:Uncharacterized protein n=1 Tax=Populus tomentosa TaxID=118781 RepID=A0A8X8CPJ6_POPTO|nr:hypothetical protein POTOM_034528 [Populus tomentosa]
MGHANVWNSHPKNYGPGSRTCFPSYASSLCTACVGIPMVLSGSMGSCAADSASVAMLRRSDSSSTAEEELVARGPLDEQKIARFCFMQYKIPRVPLD